MSTRGAIGFLINGTYKVTYNHSDSYPEWLGEVVHKFICAHTDEEMNNIAFGIELVGAEPPTPEQIQYCQDLGMADFSVSDQSEQDWYCLLRNAQGSLEVYAEVLKLMHDDMDFLDDPLFCEYAYVLDVDRCMLQFYSDEKDKRDMGSFFKIGLLAEISFDAARQLNTETFTAALDRIAVGENVDSVSEAILKYFHTK